MPACHIYSPEKCLRNIDTEFVFNPKIPKILKQPEIFAKVC
jgi:hypothetical protein